jgi:predicted transposase YbfD/YdcC
MSQKVERRRRKSKLVRHFGRIADQRSKQGRRHPQASVLAVAYAAIAAGAKSYAAMGQWSQALPHKAKTRLGCRRDQNNHYIAPSAATIRRVLQSLDPVALSELMRKAQQADQAIAVVAVDGKTMRGTKRLNTKARAVLAALDVHSGLVLGQREVSAEHLEIPEFIPLLSPLEIAGAVVTADAMHTQVANAQFLVEQKQADFLFVVKDNQGNLFGELNRWPEDRYQAPVTTVDKGHGRIETRTIWVSSAEGHFCPFPHVQQVFRVRRRVTTLTGEPIRDEISFGVTSLDANKADGNRLLEIGRQHWRIENELHYVKDQTFGEDASQIREGATVLSCLRSAVLGALRARGYRNIAAALREFAWNWQQPLALLGV